MTKQITIGESELEIMKVLWRAGTPFTSVMIGEQVAQRGWKKTTIAAFLTRLAEKCAVSAENRACRKYRTIYRRASAFSDFCEWRSQKSGGIIVLTKNGESRFLLP